MNGTMIPGVDFDAASPAAVREAIRSGGYRGYTNAVARDHVQGNLMIVPAENADAFADYCALNPQALPVIGRGRVGSPHLPEIANGLDIRSDVGGYMVFRDGELVDTPREIGNLWRDDLVAFVLGCSFSFEAVLQRNGVRLRHLDEGNVSAMYVTNLPTQRAGPFAGPLVVSMRALRAVDAIRAITISQRFPMYHGLPIHLGEPALIGIDDLGRSYGGHGLTCLNHDELPVFWACGATAQLAALQAKLPLCITHFKAHMVVTDLPVDDSDPRA
jgi:uncharacterized protein YcsI (UPF0317 family)